MTVLLDLAIAWLGVLVLLYVALLAIGLDILPKARGVRLVASAALAVLVVGGARPF